MARFIRRGVSKILFTPTLANKSAVTRTEITNATDLTASIAEVAGWSVETGQVSVPDMGSKFEKSVPGADSAPDSSLTFYEDDTTDTIETLLPKGTAGYVLIMRKGDKPTTKTLDVFPIRVGSRSAQLSVGNDPARFTVNCSITDEPALDTTIPAAGV